ncbi:diguanylate phosphodiesterase (EAL domain) [hydrothermal vent metagenome]|uniref:Diguanylate phosphodiesterase (EAL domain) n=1 Tax=hydrothermal vent metagenome TaxID=652676 RepID=A0A3B0W2D9_9ZZZZ
MQNHVFLNKQPILDANKDLYAYQLTMESLTDDTIDASEWEALAKTFYADLEEDVGVENITAGKPIFYRAPPSLLRLERLPSVDCLSTLTVEVDANVLTDIDALTALKKLKKINVSIAIVDFKPNEACTKLLSIANIVKLNANDFSPDEVTKEVEQLKSQQKMIVMTGVETEEQFEQYQASGADYYQGFFFVNPVFSSKKELSNNKLSVLKLLAEVNEPDISFEQLAETIGVDVGMTYKLLGAINHPKNNIPKRVETLKEAVNYMGLKRLKFWVNMMMMSSMEDVPDELLVVALVRAKFLEGMAEKMGTPEAKDTYFMVGLFSTLNAFLNIPMSDVVEQLPLAEDVKSALVEQSGNMGSAIWVIRSLEQGNTRLSIPGREQIDMMIISNVYMAANGWAYKTITTLNA